MHLKNIQKYLINSSPCENHDSFVEICNLGQIDFILGIDRCGWVVFDKGTRIEVTDDDEFIVFFRVLELEYSEIKKGIMKNIKSRFIDTAHPLDFMPINKILNLILKTESSYWLENCLRLLLESEYYNTNIVSIFDIDMIKRKYSQGIFHDAKKYVHRAKRNEENESGNTSN